MLTASFVITDTMILALAMLVQHYRQKVHVKDLALEDAVQDIIDLTEELEGLKNANVSA